MTVTLHRSTGRRCRGEARLLAAGVLACGAVLLPASTALANHMSMPDGTMCPHAAGDPGAAAMEGPAAPTRTASEAPLGTTAKPAVTQPAGRPAAKPASKAPAQRAAATTPASAPATTVAQSTAGAGAAAPAAQQQRAVAPVGPSRTATPRPQRRATPTHSAPARRVSTPTATTTVIPDATRPSAGSARQVASTATAAEPANVPWPAIGLGVLMLAALAAAIVVLRRRGSGGAAVTATANGPLEPSLLRPEPTELDEVDLALREMLSEARASELLGNGDRDTDWTDPPVPLVSR